MNYLVLSIIVIGMSYFYSQIKSSYKISKEIKFLFYLLICFSLCLFAGLRTKFNDTGGYIKSFTNSTPDSFLAIFSGEFSISEVYLFRIWNYVIYNFITTNVHVYLFLCSMVFVFPAISLIEKHSKNFIFSMTLFMFSGMYLFSLAGLKQAMATGVILMGLPKLFKKEYFKYYIYCIIALGFHTYSLFFLILPLLGTDIFNKKTVIFCISTIVIGITLSYFTGIISSIVEWLGKDVSEEEIQSGSVNIFRVAIFLVPFILTIFGQKNLQHATEPEKWLIKVGILSTVFMFLSLFGNPILFGRIPQYFIVGIVISMPLLIENVFEEKVHVIILFIAAFCYILFGLYDLYNDGAFVKDIFGLIWF